MTRVRLPSYPCASEELRDEVSASLNFSCPGGPPPGERWNAQRISFGHGTNWSVEQHPLRIECRLANPEMLAQLFVPAGLVCRSAKLMVALEWVSSKSSRRGFSKPLLLDHKEAMATDELIFVLDFPARELAGSIQLSLELFVGVAGKPAKEERQLANSAGLRLGAMSEPWHLAFDGAGSLFPIIHRAHRPTDPLWNFIGDWDDPTFDEFSVDFVALEINTAHPDFADLHGDSKSPYSTPLFRQVLASWLMLFLDQLQNGDGEAAGSGASYLNPLPATDGELADGILSGSIMNAAREFQSRGNLDVSSSAALLYTAQRWIDESFKRGE